MDVRDDTFPPIIDTHVHLNLFVPSAHLSECAGFIVPSTTADKWADIRTLAHTYPHLFPAYGLHPWFKHTQADLDTLSNIAPTGVAIGECGLDKQLSEIPFQIQLEQLHPQLAIAKAGDLPVILHCVKAGDQLAQVLKQYPSLRGVVHGFSGSAQQAKRFIDLGFYIGISHVTSNPNATRLHEMLKKLPLDRLLLETDAPNKQFSCAAMYKVRFQSAVTRIATHLGLSETALIAQSNHNAKALFGISEGLA